MDHPIEFYSLFFSRASWNYLLNFTEIDPFLERFHVYHTLQF